MLHTSPLLNMQKWIGIPYGYLICNPIVCGLAFEINVGSYAYISIHYDAFICDIREHILHTAHLLMGSRENKIADILSQMLMTISTSVY